MRTIVYVDGFNLYNRKLKNRPQFKWLNLKTLVQLALPMTVDIVRVNFYTARVSDALDAGAPRRQQMYFDALETVPEIKIHNGKFAYREHWAALAESGATKPEGYIWRQPRPELICVKKVEEKGSDVNLGCH